MATTSAGFAGDEALPKGTKSPLLRVWTGPDKPALALNDINGDHVRLGPGDSAINIVHFFATWCEPCRAELPALDRLIARSDPAKLRVLTISVAEAEARIKSFVEKHPVGLQILLDRDRSIARGWQVHALPTTFILDGDLRPRYFIEREYDWDSFHVADFAKVIAAEKRAGIPITPTADPNHTTTDFEGGQP